MNYANQYQISFSGVNKIVAPEKDEQFLIMKWDVLEQAFKKLTNPSERARKSLEKKGFLKVIKGNLLLFDPCPKIQ